MRTTLTLDDDVLELATRQAEARGLSLGKAISAAMRRGLNAPTPLQERNGLVTFRLPEDSPKVTTAAVRRLETWDQRIGGTRIRAEGWHIYQRGRARLSERAAPANQRAQAHPTHRPEIMLCLLHSASSTPLCRRTRPGLQAAMLRPRRARSDAPKTAAARLNKGEFCLTHPPDTQNQTAADQKAAAGEAQ